VSDILQGEKEILAFLLKKYGITEYRYDQLKGELAIGRYPSGSLYAWKEDLIWSVELALCKRHKPEEPSNG